MKIYLKASKIISVVLLYRQANDREWKLQN